MFFETRKPIESSNLSYTHDLIAKFEDNIQNGRHTPISIGYTFANIADPTEFCNYKPNII